VITDVDYRLDIVGMRKAAGRLTNCNHDDSSYQLVNEHRSAASNGFNTTHTYDGVGNRLVKNEAGALTTSTFDAANQTIIATSASERLAGDNDLQRRPAAALAGGVAMAKTYLFWDPLEDNVVRETDEAGVVTAEYTTEPELYGNVISQRRQGQYRQFHYDGQGSTLAATDENQAATDTFAYSALGEVTERTGASTIPLQYIGQKGYYTDGLTGQINARRRPYEPVRARWLSVDPLQLIPLSEWYVYSANSPVLHIDPSGRRLIAPGRGGPTQVANSMDDVWNEITTTLGYKPSSDGNCACVTLRWALFWPSMRDILWRG
jgi:RHS repeat-associated protein